jgi:hypothetical protein
VSLSGSRDPRRMSLLKILRESAQGLLVPLLTNEEEKILTSKFVLAISGSLLPFRLESTYNVDFYDFISKKSSL